MNLSEDINYPKELLKYIFDDEVIQYFKSQFGGRNFHLKWNELPPDTLYFNYTHNLIVVGASFDYCPMYINLKENFIRLSKYGNINHHELKNILVSISRKNKIKNL
jgi:hypothetical protein